MTFLLSPLGRAIGGAFVLIASFFTWLAFHDAKVEQRGADKIVAATNKQAEKTSEKATRNRGRADAVPDPVAELRKRSCGDC